MPKENPDLVVHGSYTYQNGFRAGLKRTITAHREYRNTAYPNCECVASFDDADEGDRIGTGSTPEAALDDLLESEELRDE